MKSVIAVDLIGNGEAVMQSAMVEIGVGRVIMAEVMVVMALKVESIVVVT